MSDSSIREQASELSFGSLWSDGQADLHPGSTLHSPGLTGCRRGGSFYNRRRNICSAVKLGSGLFFYTRGGH